MRALTGVLAAGLVFGASGIALAATASSDATATIIAPIGITKNVDLAFGNIAANASTAGTVELTASATPSRTPTTVTLPASTGTVTAAKFTLNGTTGLAYTVTLPSGASTLTSGANTMTVDTWVDSLTAHAGTIDTTPADNIFYVGGTLHVGAAQAAGTYTGTFDVVVAYD